MKRPDKKADTLFVYGFSAFYNVSVRIIRDIYDESQVYYFCFMEPTDLITVCSLSSGKHYYASRQIASTIPEEHSIPLLTQLDAPVSHVNDLANNNTMGSMDTITIEPQLVYKDLPIPQTQLEPDHLNATK